MDNSEKILKFTAIRDSLLGLAQAIYEASTDRDALKGSLCVEGGDPVTQVIHLLDRAKAWAGKSNDIKDEYLAARDAKYAQLEYYRGPGEARCIKCGNMDNIRTYKKVESSFGNYGSTDPEQRKIYKDSQYELMLRECPTCGHSWQEKPLDVPPGKYKEPRVTGGLKNDPIYGEPLQAVLVLSNDSRMGNIVLPSQGRPFNLKGLRITDTVSYGVRKEVSISIDAVEYME